MDSVQQEQQLNNAVLSNTIIFNGEITSDFIDVGGGYLAVEFLAGKNKEEFPTLLIDKKEEQIIKTFKKGDIVLVIGMLEKIQQQFIIKVAKMDFFSNIQE